MAPLVIAHRGASAAHPPGNTLEAFRAAGELGAAWVELDVRRCRDGALAVHHDAHLSDGRVIAELDGPELPADVPVLAAALEACGTMGVNVEIKSAPGEPDFDPSRSQAEATLAVLAGCGLPAERLLVTSFDPVMVARVRQLDPVVPTGLLVFAVDDAVALADSAAEAGHVAVNPWDPLVDEALVRAAHDAGLAVHAWTVDDPERMDALAGLGVDGIITNVPDRLVEVLARR